MGPLSIESLGSAWLTVLDSQSALLCWPGCCLLGFRFGGQCHGS